MATSDLSLSGLASGFDWKSVVDQLIAVERTPQQRLLLDQSKLTQKTTAYGNIKTQMAALQTRIQELKDPTLYDSRNATSSDLTAGTTSAAKGAVLGSFAFNISQLATASRINGSANAGSALSQTTDVSGVTLSSAGFPAAITAGTFTVNGKQVTVATTDTLQGVFNKIAAATGNDVTAAYDPASDKITLTGSGEVILGSATDSSNFLQAARLYNTGTDTTSSSVALGSVRLTAAMSASNLATPLSDGGSGAGKFKINGVSISFKASTDTVNDVINRINVSTAGVTASYDTLNDRFVLASKSTGDIGIAMEDVTGNFLAATGLSGGTLAHGKNLIYTLNNSDPIVSQSNTITESSSGIAGLSVTALKENSTVTVTVGSDTDKIKVAVKNFIESYNRVQSLVDSQTASSTDSKGKVTAGVLAGDSDASDISSDLRSNIYSLISGLSGTIKHLSDLGIKTNGDNNSITLEDEDKLNAALTNNLSGVKEFLSDATKGMAVKVDQFITKTIGDDGSLVTHQNNLNTRSKAIDQQVADMERRLTAEKDRLTAGFVAMETAQAKLTQQLQYLTKQFGS